LHLEAPSPYSPSSMDLVDVTFSAPPFLLTFSAPPRWWNLCFIAIFTWLLVLVSVSVASALVTSAQALLNGTWAAVLW
jgi:hypothetical protein